MSAADESGEMWQAKRLSYPIVSSQPVFRMLMRVQRI